MSKNNWAEAATTTSIQQQQRSKSALPTVYIVSFISNRKESLCFHAFACSPAVKMASRRTDSAFNSVIRTGKKSLPLTRL